ncbi:MAG: hypothetical protein QXW39_02585 [Candidatus Bathyarchaeia archaeon]
MEKYTAEVSAMKIVERIKILLSQGVSLPLKKRMDYRGIWWNSVELKRDQGYRFRWRL